jgi:hypothetical protein
VDDYFDYLIGVTKRDDIIPSSVVRALSDNTLLFLGFQVEDWNFRILFRSIMNEESSSRRGKKANVAAQIDPEEGSGLDPQRARQYLQHYFAEEHINIYWGSTEAFMTGLWMRWQKVRGGVHRPATESRGSPLVTTAVAAHVHPYVGPRPFTEVVP